jgi:hypothetical protein
MRSSSFWVLHDVDVDSSPDVLDVHDATNSRSILRWTGNSISKQPVASIFSVEDFYPEDG